MVRPGVTTAEIDEAVARFLEERNAVPVRTRHGEGTACPAAYVSVNDEVMNGIPGLRRLHEGDVVTIDIACRFEGWWADSAVTLGVGAITPEAERLLATARGALDLGIGRLS